MWLLYIGTAFLPDFYDLAYLDILLFDWLPAFGLVGPYKIIGIIEVVLFGIKFEGEVPADDLNADVPQGEWELNHEYLPLNITVPD